MAFYIFPNDLNGAWCDPSISLDEDGGCEFRVSDSEGVASLSVSLTYLELINIHRATGRAVAAMREALDGLSGS